MSSSPFFLLHRGFRSTTLFSLHETASYPPCNKVKKRSQQNACTHWSTTACDVIRHPKTMFPRWSILPKELQELHRFALLQQYALLYSGRKFHYFFFNFFSSVFGFFVQANISWVFFFFWFFIIDDGRLPFLLSVKMIHYLVSTVHWSLKQVCKQPLFVVLHCNVTTGSIQNLR